MLTLLRESFAQEGKLSRNALNLQKRKINSALVGEPFPLPGKFMDKSRASRRMLLSIICFLVPEYTYED